MERLCLPCGQEQQGKARQGKAAGLGWLGACLPQLGTAGSYGLRLQQGHSLLSGTVLLTGTPAICLQSDAREEQKEGGKNQKTTEKPIAKILPWAKTTGQEGLSERPLTLKRNPSNPCPPRVNFQPSTRSVSSVASCFACAPPCFSAGCSPFRGGRGWPWLAGDSPILLFTHSLRGTGESVTMANVRKHSWVKVRQFNKWNSLRKHFITSHCGQGCREL